MFESNAEERFVEGSAIDAASDQYLTPPALARRWRVDVGRVLAWIRAGELVAVNMASSLAGRPRYRIRPVDIEAFELRRMVLPMPARRKVSMRDTRAEVLATLGADLGAE